MRRAGAAPPGLLDATTFTSSPGRGDIICVPAPLDDAPQAGTGTTHGDQATSRVARRGHRRPDRRVQRRRVGRGTPGHTRRPGDRPRPGHLADQPVRHRPGDRHVAVAVVGGDPDGAPLAAVRDRAVLRLDGVHPVHHQPHPALRAALRAGLLRRPDHPLPADRGPARPGPADPSVRPGALRPDRHVRAEHVDHPGSAVDRRRRLAVRVLRDAAALRAGRGAGLVGRGPGPAEVRAAAVVRLVWRAAGRARLQRAHHPAGAGRPLRLVQLQDHLRAGAGQRRGAAAVRGQRVPGRVAVVRVPVAEASQPRLRADYPVHLPADRPISLHHPDRLPYRRAGVPPAAGLRGSRWWWRARSSCCCRWWRCC